MADSNGAARRPIPDGVLYANVNEIPWFYRMVPTRGPDGTPLSVGHRQYLVHCAACHGADRRGDVRGGMPALDALKGRTTAEQVSKVIVTGGGRMPPFDRLGERQRTAIVGFLLGNERGARHPPPASRPTAGAARRRIRPMRSAASSGGSIARATRRSSRRGAR